MRREKGPHLIKQPNQKNSKEEEDIFFFTQLRQESLAEFKHINKQRKKENNSDTQR